MPIINSISIETSAWWLQNYVHIDQSRWPEVVKACGQVAATYYHQRLLERRFKAGNEQKFHLQPRKPKYVAQKVAMARRGKVLLGGAVDLVKFGELRTRLQAFGAVSATTKKATLTMVGPYYTRIQRPGAPDKALEILLLLEDEKQEIQDTQQTEMLDKMLADHGIERETI